MSAVWLAPASLVEESAVGVLAKECFSHSRRSRVLEECQPRLKGIIDVDFAVSAGDDDATGPNSQVSNNSASKGSHQCRRNHLRLTILPLRGSARQSWP